MAKFIELTQLELGRKIMVNIDHIQFFYEKRIVFDKGGTDVLESYEEITKLINRES